MESRKSLEVRYNYVGERLRVDGYRIFTSLEEELFYKIKPHQFFQLLECAFRHAYIEAKYLGIDYKQEREAFKLMNDASRGAAVNCCLFAWKEAVTRFPGHVPELNYRPATDEEIWIDVHNRYNRGQKLLGDGTKEG